MPFVKVHRRWTLRRKPVVSAQNRRLRIRKKTQFRKHNLRISCGTNASNKGNMLHITIRNCLLWANHRNSSTTHTETHLLVFLQTAIRILVWKTLVPTPETTSCMGTAFCKSRDLHHLRPTYFETTDRTPQKQL